MEAGIKDIEVRDILGKGKQVAVCIRFVDGSSLDFGLTQGKGIYGTKYRWNYNHRWKNDDIFPVVRKLAAWQSPTGAENPFAKGGSFDEMHLMFLHMATGKKGKPTVVWREIFKIHHQKRHDLAMERVREWDSTQLTTGLFRTFLWHLLFEYEMDFETATFEQVESFLHYVNCQVESGVYQKSYANQAIRIAEFFANLPIYNKKGALRRPASNIQNPHITEAEVNKLMNVFQVVKRIHMPPKTPFESHIRKLEEQLVKHARSLEKVVVEKRKKHPLGLIDDSLREDWIRVNRSLAIFLLIKEHGLFPKDAMTLQLKWWDPQTGKLGITDRETVTVSPSLKKTLMDYLEAVERRSSFLEHDQDHLLVCRSYYPSVLTMNEWIETGEVTNPGSYTYRSISGDIIERVFVLYEKDVQEGEVKRLKISAKKVRNYFLKVNLKGGVQPMKISYYSKKYLSELPEDSEN